MARYGSCVITEIASACEAWPMLLAAARTVHASDAALRYSAWRGLHATWRGYQPSQAAAEEIADVVEVRDAFASDSASRRFSAFDAGPLWPVANVSHSGRVLVSPQPWPDIPGFAKSVTEAFTAAH